MAQHIILQNPSKFTQIGMFVLKIYHLATLVQSVLRFLFDLILKAGTMGKYSQGFLLETKETPQ
jgi:hypothetical protein